MELDTILLTSLIFLVAILYSSVGHGGASGYLAAMACIGIAPAVMKPTALGLNILVATIATVKYGQVGAFSLPLFWPLVTTSIPLAFLGGRFSLPADWYQVAIGLVLIYAAGYGLYRSYQVPQSLTSVILPARWLLLLVGGSIGFLSGLTGVGGGIFLSPILLFNRWAEIRTISGISAAFILVNSIAGLLGASFQGTTVSEQFPLWALAAIAGGWLGSEWGSQHFDRTTLYRLLSLVMGIAGLKNLMSR
jgi:uncharacterized membrane protein YfcA